MGPINWRRQLNFKLEYLYTANYSSFKNSYTEWGCQTNNELSTFLACGISANFGRMPPRTCNQSFI